MPEQTTNFVEFYLGDITVKYDEFRNYSQNGDSHYEGKHVGCDVSTNNLSHLQTRGSNTKRLNVHYMVV